MKFTYITSPEQAKQTVKTGEKFAFFVHNYTGDLHIDIQAENAEVYIFGLYVGRKSDTFTLRTTQKHSVGKNVSDLLIKGVLYDKAKFTYEGLIHISKNAQQSNAYQKNQNLLMSKNAYVDSRPFLEIQANDVRCTHGSTTGKLREDQLLYVQSRRLSKQKAEELLIEGFIQDIFHRMKEVGVSNEALTSLRNTLLR